jgi:hypothetical protein
LTTHTAPELEFLQAKWAAHLSFVAVAELLHDVMPVDSCLNGETIRMHVFATAERLEAELGPEQFVFDAGCQIEIAGILTSAFRAHFGLVSHRDAR